MRLAQLNGRTVIVAGDHAVDVALASNGRFGPDAAQVLLAWEQFLDWAHDVDVAAAGAPLNGPLGPPVPHPQQVFAVALNYSEHARETRFDVPDELLVFTKFPSCLTGPQDAVRLPSESVDFEAELVAVIGRRAFRVSEADGWKHVAGLTIGQDLSERVVQLAGTPPQFSLGKSFPGFGPTGPYLVTPDELADPDDLEISCRIEDGEILQQGRTSDMIFRVAELVARLSAVCPLLPGDLIFTGTPAGVGMARTPKRFLRPGELLVTAIEGLGELRNRLYADD